jgi:rubrerythrin
MAVKMVKQDAGKNAVTVEKENKLCPNCGFTILEYDENGELTCPVCNYGKTRYHT